MPEHSMAGWNGKCLRIIWMKDWWILNKGLTFWLSSADVILPLCADKMREKYFFLLCKDLREKIANNAGTKNSLMFMLLLEVINLSTCAKIYLKSLCHMVMYVYCDVKVSV